MENPPFWWNLPGNNYAFFSIAMLVFPEGTLTAPPLVQRYLEAEDTHGHQQNHRSEKSGVAWLQVVSTEHQGESKVMGKKGMNTKIEENTEKKLDIHDEHSWSTKTQLQNIPATQTGIATTQTPTISTKKPRMNLANNTRNPPLSIGAGNPDTRETHIIMVQKLREPGVVCLGGAKKETSSEIAFEMLGPTTLEIRRFYGNSWRFCGGSEMWTCVVICGLIL